MLEDKYTITLQVTLRAKHTAEADFIAGLLQSLLTGRGEVEASVVSVKNQYEKGA